MAQTGREVIVVTGKWTEVGFIAEKNRQINAVQEKLIAEGKEIVNIIESPPDSMMGFKTQQVTILWKLPDKPVQAPPVVQAPPIIQAPPVIQAPPTMEKVNVTSDNFNSILDRIDLFLEDQEWDRAIAYCESALDFAPKSADVYLKYLLADLKFTSFEKLVNSGVSYENNEYYQKALRFSDENLIKKLNDSISKIKEIEIRDKFDNLSKFAAEALLTIDYKDRKAVIEDFSEACNSLASKEFVEECLSELPQFCEDMCSVIEKRIEEVLNDDQFENAISCLDYLKNCPKAVEMKMNYQNYWQKTVEESLENWKNYSNVVSIINELKEKLDQKTNSMNDAKAMERHARTSLESLHDNQMRISVLEKSLQEWNDQKEKLNSELSALGLFAMSRKKEINAQIINLESSISNSQNELKSLKVAIERLGREETLSKLIVDKQKSVQDYTCEIELINKRIDDFKFDHETLLQKVMNRQSIAIITENPDYIVACVNDDIISIIIQSDDELRALICSYDSFYTLNESSYDVKTSFSPIDVEAIYYQAVQAFEYARNIDDIEWAYEQFSRIPFYKDSREYMKKCREKLDLRHVIIDNNG